MTLAELLGERKIDVALLIDDAFDALPRATDLANDRAAWSNFVDDLGEDVELVRRAFPEFDQMSPDDLVESDEFVAVVYQLRGSLKPETVNPLFRAFDQGKESDLKVLTQLESALHGFGLKTEQAGRDVREIDANVKLIFIDLFLGSAQKDFDVETSLKSITSLLANRESNPPIVILMSRSSRLTEKRNEFRDKAGLLGTLFRVYTKNELTNGDTLEIALERLARHYPDALLIADFLHQWNLGLAGAAKRFQATVRRLDLSDYSQIQSLLLNFEGLPLGSYLLDVFDRVLQYEIEGHEGTINAAIALSQVDSKEYPPPYLGGSPDLQQLIYRSVWHNRRRLQIPLSSVETPVSFGDVLLRRSSVEQSERKNDEEPEALVVLTPACDLIRRADARILLMAGNVKSHKPGEWTYKASNLRTSIFITHDERRLWLAWDIKDLRAFSSEEVAQMTEKDGAYGIVGRLREGRALELQQRLLADLGRVGLPANMPSTFAVRVEVFVVLDVGSKEIRLPTLQREGGVCFVGRDEKGNDSSHLVLCEDGINELAVATNAVVDTSIPQNARGSFRHVKDSGEFPKQLERSLEIPGANLKGWKQVPLHLKTGLNTSTGIYVGWDSSSVDQIPGNCWLALRLSVDD